MDDLTEGKGKEFVDKSAHLLAFLTDGYFQSKNCMRELTRAIFNGTPVIVLLEPDHRRGGLAQEQASERYPSP